LKREPGVEVQVVDGDRGELSVVVDGKTVAQKGADMPDIASVLDAVREAGTLADAS